MSNKGIEASKILFAAGYTEEAIQEMSFIEAEERLLKLGYDHKGEKLPQATELIETRMPLTLVEAIEFDEYTLSGTAENTLNIGNYSSAKRGVFVGRKLRVPRDLPEAQRYELLKTETKKLQFLAEAQLSGICKEAMGPGGFNDTSWHNVVSGIFVRATKRVKELFETKVVVVEGDDTEPDGR